MAAKNRHTRAAILQAATRLFRANGFNGTGIADIARAVGITNAAIYYHFDSKQALLYWCLRDGVDGYLERLESIRDIADDRERIYAALENHFDLIFERPDAVRVFIRERRYLEGEYAVDYQVRIKRYDQLFDGVLFGYLSGQPQATDPTLLRLSILGMFNWVTEWFRDDGPLSEDVVRRDLIEIAAHRILGLQTEGA